MVKIKNENKLNFIAALPIALIGLGITGGCLVAGGACYEIPSWRLYSGIAFGGLIALLIGAVSVWGLVRKIPDWSVIWIAISLIGFIVLLNFVSMLDLPSSAEVTVLIFSMVTGLTIFYLISKKTWQLAGLFGIGLSTALSLILFFMATNISHNEIKIGYFNLILGISMGWLVYLYLKGNNKIKVLALIVFVILNSLMVFVFDNSMQKINHKSQLLYLTIFSNGLLFSGIIFHYVMRLLNRILHC